ncbi:hypothetical protein Taro_012052 [Colocasia esculenta]|uniref:Aminotransferase-like plant mobile domain-containing protein n=1 Tax=Colocasia esculenta TaxID=4460 RepID=A0A843UEH2_COLES|nr:hypothetical protein [Colocasia esculenta]
MLLPTHYLSAWAGLLLPGLCQTVDLPRPMAPLVLLFRNRPSRDTLKGLVDARSSLSFLPNGEQGLLPFGNISRGSRPYSIKTSGGTTYHIPHGDGPDPSLYQDWLRCIRPGVLVYRGGQSLILEPYYPSRFARNFGYDQLTPPNAKFPLMTRLNRSHRLHLNAAAWWNYFCREEVGSTCAFPNLEAIGRVDVFYARWWFGQSNIFRVSHHELREAEESRLEKHNLPPICIHKKFLSAHFKSLVDSYTSYYEEAMQNGPLPVEKNFYRGELQCLEPVELFSTKASNSDDLSDFDWWSCLLSDCGYRPNVPLSKKLPPECIGNQGWARWERHLINMIGHAGSLEYIPLLETASTLYDVWVIMGRVSDICKIDSKELVSPLPAQTTALPVLRIDGNRDHEARSRASSSRDMKTDKGKAVVYCPPNDDEENEENADLIAPDKYTPLLGDSFLPYGMECGSSSRAGGDLTSEVDFIEPSSHCPFPETVATRCNDSASAYADYKVFAEQYSFTPVDAYIPRPDGEYPAAEATSSDRLGSPFFMSQAYSAFQVGDSADDNGPFGQEFYAEESNFVQPLAPEAEAEGGNLPYSNPPPSDFDDGGSPPLGLEALSEHGVDWPSRDQPSPGPEDEDLWNFLVGRVRAVVNSEDPPSIDVVKRVLKEKTMLAFNLGIAQNRWMSFVGDIWDEVCRRHSNVVWAPYDRRIQTLEGDICSLTRDADRCSSRLVEVRKGRKARKLKITAEMENIVRLQRELEEARSSLEQEVKDDTKDSEEEAAFIKDDEEHRRSTSSKTKEVERLKRKKPSWLRFGLNFKCLPLSGGKGTVPLWSTCRYAPPSYAKDEGPNNF